MYSFLFVNNVKTTLATAINTTATSITLANSANLPTSIPAGYYLAITLNDAATEQIYEIVYATAVSGSTLTVLRAQEGTSAQSWLVGDLIWSGPTAGQMESFGESSFVNPMTTEGDIIVGGASGAATRLGAATAGYVLTTNGAGALPSWAPGGGGGTSGVTSFNTRTGAVTLSYGDVTTALGFTPYSAAGGTIGGNVTVTGSATFDTTVVASGNIATSGGLFAIANWTISVSGGNLIFTDTTTGKSVTFSSTGSVSANGTIQGGT